MANQIATNRDGNITPVIGDKNTNALLTIDIDHYLVHKNKLFSAYHENVSVAGATFQFSFKTPPIENGLIHYRSAGIQPNKDNVRTQIYESAVINVAGTLVEFDSNNRYLDGDVPVGLELRAGTTFSNNGVLLPGFSNYLPGSEGNGQARTPSAGNPAVDEIILKPNTVYRFININGSTEINTIASKFRFYVSQSMFEGEDD